MSYVLHLLVGLEHAIKIEENKKLTKFLINKAIQRLFLIAFLFESGQKN